MSIERKKILHVIDALTLGGKERMAVDIANESSLRGYDVRVCVTRSEAPLARDLLPAVKLYEAGRKSRFDAAGAIRFLNIVRQERPDVLHVHGRSSFSFAGFLKMLGLIRAPIIFHDHYSVEVDTRIPFWMKFFLPRYAALYAGAYGRLAKWASDAAMAKEKIHIIGNAIDFKRFEIAAPSGVREELKIGREETMAILIANVRYEKGIDLLIDAVRLRPAIARAKYLIAGKDDGKYADACKKKIKASNLEGSFRWLGRRADIPRLLKSSDLGLITSRSESGPLALIEYMICGLPFIAARVGDVAEKVFQKGLPAFFNPGDAAALAQRIEEFLALHRSEKLARGEAGKAIAQSEFNIKTAVEKWEQLYRTCMEMSR